LHSAVGTERGHHGRDRMEYSWILDLQLPMEAVFITNKVVSSNPARGEV